MQQPEDRSASLRSVARVLAEVGALDGVLAAGGIRAELADDGALRLIELVAEKRSVDVDC